MLGEAVAVSWPEQKRVSGATATVGKGSTVTVTVSLPPQGRRERTV